MICARYLHLKSYNYDAFVLLLVTSFLLVTLKMKYVTYCVFKILYNAQVSEANKHAAFRIRTFMPLLYRMERANFA